MDKTYLLLRDIKQCPALYLGKPSLKLLYTFLNGYKHHEIPSPPDCLDGFQEYIEEIYDIHTTHHWANIIQFYSSTEEEAFNKFYEHFGNFIRNKSDLFPDVGMANRVDKYTEIIREKLREIEEKEKVTVLLAVESGSRAWGFASPDSDYDVRFLYVRPKEHYLRLQKRRDVIEYMLDDVLDINGWDIDKTLRLMRGSNPTLFEWLSSPVVYAEKPFAVRLREASRDCFLAKPGLHHYLSMAAGNYREYLKGDFVRLKKYFYVLRPLLACRYILEHGTQPPMLFDTLLRSQMDDALIPAVEQLMERKRQTPELGEGLRVDALNEFIEAELSALEERIARLPDRPKLSWEPLNELFMKALEQNPVL